MCHWPHLAGINQLITCKSSLGQLAQMVKRPLCKKRFSKDRGSKQRLIGIFSHGFFHVEVAESFWWKMALRTMRKSSNDNYCQIIVPYHQLWKKNIVINGSKKEIKKVKNEKWWDRVIARQVRTILEKFLRTFWRELPQYLHFQHLSLSLLPSFGWYSEIPKHGCLVYIHFLQA